MKPRIVLTSNFSPWSAYSGGGQRSTHHIAEQLSKLGYQVNVIFTSTIFEKINVPENLPYTIHWAKYPGFKSSRKNIFRLLSIFSVKAIAKKLITPSTIVHCNGEEGALLKSLQKDVDFKLILTPRYPHIPTKVAGVTPTVWNALRFPSISKYILLYKCINEFDAICPTSQSASTMITDVFDTPSTKLQIVPNGVAHEFFSDSDSSRKETDLKRIIFFGRLSKTKGVDTLLKACALKSSMIDDIVIIGRGELEDFINETNKSGPLANKIKLLPWLPIRKLVEHLKEATVAVLPSREESFGNSIAEAMACRIPVITTTAGSVPEIVGNSENGILVDPEDYEGVAEAIQRLLSDSDYRNKMAENGYNRILDNFSWENTAQKYISIYNQ
ncbi:MAG: glycosyltransferase family 4 protein [Balneolaceae bacterium]